MQARPRGRGARARHLLQPGACPKSRAKASAATQEEDCGDDDGLGQFFAVYLTCMKMRTTRVA